MKKTLKIGKITKTHGIKGEVRALYYTDSPEYYSGLKKLTLMPSRESAELLSARPVKGALLLRLRGVDSIEKAKALCGSEIFIDRDEAPPLPPGRYYVEDVLGLSVLCEDGRRLGKITRVISGGGDVYEVRGEGEYLIPTNVITEYNIEKGYILINPTPGLLD